MKVVTKYLLLLILTVATSAQIYAQGQRKAIVFTGRVVGKNAQVLSKVYIFIPKAGRGTLSDESGYFAVQVFPGDSVLFSHLSYEKQYLTIPSRLMEDSYSAIVMLKDDVKTLKEVRVYPYSTEQEFKDAFLSMTLPDDLDRRTLEKNTNPDYLMQMTMITPMTAMGNYRAFMDQQQYGRENTAYRSNINTPLNPLALLSAIKSIKRGDLKTKDYRKILSQSPKENVSREDIIRK